MRLQNAYSLTVASLPQVEQSNTSARSGPDSSPVLWLLTFCMIATSAILIYQNPGVLSFSGSQPFAISATEVDGRMRVTWDRNSPAIAQADGAQLDVRDGGSTISYSVGIPVLQSGNLDYVRNSGDMMLSLTLFRAGKPIDRSIIHSIGYQPFITTEIPRTSVRYRKSK